MDWALVDIILKVPFLERAIWKEDATDPVLYALAPFSFIHASVGPQHLAVAMSFVIDIVSLEDVAARPGEYSSSIFHFVGILTFVLITVWAW